MTRTTRSNDDAAVALALALAAAIYYAAVADPPRVTVRANPRVVMAGNAVGVTCRVPRHPDNRGLTVGIDGYRSSYVQLDGEAARVTHLVTYEHVPCEAGDAYCVLADAGGRTWRAAEPVLVSGCDAGR